MSSYSLDSDPPTTKSLMGTLQQTMATVKSRSSKYLDAYLPPQTRQQWTASLTNFALQRPYLASFIICQAVICGLPLFFIVSTALLFTVMLGIFLASVVGFFFMMAGCGFAVLVVLPIFVFTFGTAVFAWGWTVVAIAALKWIRRKNLERDAYKRPDWKTGNGGRGVEVDDVDTARRDSTTYGTDTAGEGNADRLVSTEEEPVGVHDTRSAQQLKRPDQSKSDPIQDEQRQSSQGRPPQGVARTPDGTDSQDSSPQSGD